MERSEGVKGGEERGVDCRVGLGGGKGSCEGEGRSDWREAEGG